MTPLAYLRLGGYALLAVALIACGLTVRSWHQKALRVDAAEARIEQIAREAKGAMAALAEAHRKALDASRGYQDELRTLRANRGKSRVVRLCNDVPANPPEDGGAGRRDGASPGAGELPQAAGPDIGPDLYGLADDADEVAARLRACQALLR